MTENEATKDLPRVMMAMPVKNCAKWLPGCLRALLEMDYPHERLRFVFGYGQSSDGTRQVIEESLTGTDVVYEILNELEIPWTKSATYLAGTMNLLQDQLRDEDYILYADADVIRMPRNMLKVLISANKDVVAPCLMFETDGGHLAFYDCYVFRDLRGRDLTAVQRNPRHPWLDKDSVEMMSIGTLGLVKRKVAEEVRWGNPLPWLQYCLNARGKGFQVWALPSLRILHANVETQSSTHVRLEEYVRRGIVPSSELKKTQTLSGLPLLQERASSYARRVLDPVRRTGISVMRRYPPAGVLIRNLRRRQQTTCQNSQDSERS